MDKLLLSRNWFSKNLRVLSATLLLLGIAGNARAQFKQSQTIIFNQIAAKTYGDPDFSTNAIATSGLTVSLASNNSAVATIVNGNIHITGAGSATITASQAGSGFFSPAPNVTQTLTVNKAAQTITFAAITAKTYGDADFAPGASSIAGAVTYSSDNVNVATIVNGNVHIVGSGAANITASQAGNGK
jgi:trimeric autotransporter adhesin